MPATITSYEIEPVFPRRKQWTRDDLKQIESQGLLAGQRYELIEGDLIDKMGKKRPHTISLMLLMEWLVSVFGWKKVNPETSIDVSPIDNPINEPEPDLIGT